MGFVSFSAFPQLREGQYLAGAAVVIHPTVEKALEAAPYPRDRIYPARPPRESEPGDAHIVGSEVARRL